VSKKASVDYLDRYADPLLWSPYLLLTLSSTSSHLLTLSSTSSHLMTLSSTSSHLMTLSSTSSHLMTLSSISSHLMTLSSILSHLMTLSYAMLCYHRVFVDMMWYKAFSVYLVLRHGMNVLFQVRYLTVR